MKLGCIADDFISATDLALTLVRAGMRADLVIGLPNELLESDADAVVVVLNTRAFLIEKAVLHSISALCWLHAQGAQQIYLNYCSSHASSALGSVGPVTEALMDALADKPGGDFTITTPAFPRNKHSVINGYLFVDGVLIHECGTQASTIIPTADSNLVRVLQAQCLRKVGLIDYKVVAQGPQAIRARIGQLRADGVGMAVVDAISDSDLMKLGPVLKGMPLVAAGSGLAIGVPANFGIAPSTSTAELPPAIGFQAVISRSSSPTTEQQITAFIKSGQPALEIDLVRMAIMETEGEDGVAEVLSWAEPLLIKGPLLIYLTSDKCPSKSGQSKLAAQAADAFAERIIGAVALGLALRGVGQLIVVGSETLTACVHALNIKTMKFGHQIEPKLPWCYALSVAAPNGGLHLTLKPCDFGTEDFFSDAFTKCHDQVQV